MSSIASIDFFGTLPEEITFYDAASLAFIQLRTAVRVYVTAILFYSRNRVGEPVS